MSMNRLDLGRAIMDSADPSAHMPIRGPEGSEGFTFSFRGAEQREDADPFSLNGADQRGDAFPLSFTGADQRGDAVQKPTQRNTTTKFCTSQSEETSMETDTPVGAFLTGVFLSLGAFQVDRRGKMWRRGGGAFPLKLCISRTQVVSLSGCVKV